MSLNAPYEDTNIFAKIIAGDMPCVKVFEDTATLAFMDIFPQTEGHCLVIPKSLGATNLLTGLWDAKVDRAPVVVASGTEGTCPVLARQIKTQIEEQVPQNLGGLAALAGRLRGAVAKQVARRNRRSFWRWVFGTTASRYSRIELSALRQLMCC